MNVAKLGFKILALKSMLFYSSPSNLVNCQYHLKILPFPGLLVSVSTRATVTE